MNELNTGTLHAFDWVLIAAYFLALMGLSWRRNGSTSSAEEFLLSGRRLTLPALVATLVSTWYGGILGVGEFTVQYGVSQWLLFAFPFYVFAIVFAVYLAPKIRTKLTITLPESLAAVYGKRAGILAGAGVFVLASPAPYILMVGVLMQFLLGASAPLLVYAALVALISGLYTTWGGFSAVVRTDMLQIILMYGGFFMLVWAAWLEFDGIKGLLPSLPETHLELTGGHTPQYILVWFFIAMWTFVDPGFHQRASAAVTPAVAKKGILVSVLCWMVFDALTLSAGLFGVLMTEQLAHPMMVYPVLADTILPFGLKGVFFVGLLATIMSTMDSYFLISGQTFARDLRSSPAHHEVKSIRWGIALSGVIALLLISLFPSVIQLWYVIGSAIIPALLIPVLGVYQSAFQLPPQWVPRLMISSCLAGISWMGAGLTFQGDTAWLGMEPFYAGLLVSIVIWLAGKSSKA